MLNWRNSAFNKDKVKLYYVTAGLYHGLKIDYASLLLIEFTNYGTHSRKSSNAIQIMVLRLLIILKFRFGRLWLMILFLFQWLDELLMPCLI